MGWSSTEDLLVVQDDGVVLMYDLFGQFKKTIGMGQVCLIGIFESIFIISRCDLPNCHLKVCVYDNLHLRRLVKQKFWIVRYLTVTMVLESPSWQLLTGFLYSTMLKIRAYGCLKISQVCCWIRVFMFSLIIVLNSLKNIWLLLLSGLNALPNCWTVVSEDRTTEVMLIQGNELFVVGTFHEPIKKVAWVLIMAVFAPLDYVSFNQVPSF